MISANDALEIRNAILGNGITAYAQPIVALTDDEHELANDIPNLSFEFLVRLMKADGSVLAYGEFKEVAESDPVLLARIDHQVLRQAVYQMSVWKETLGLDVHGHVNACQATLRNRNYAAYVEKLLHEYGVAANLLTIEVLETCQNFWRSKSILRTLMVLSTELQVNVAIDDWGPEWTNMPGLMRWIESAERYVILSAVKIDRSMVVSATPHTLPDGTFVPPNMADVAKILHCCEAMRNRGISVVAEGIENQETLNIMRELGCNFVQGYVLGKPKSLAETTMDLAALYEIRLLPARGMNYQTQRPAMVSH